jgi:hypothetical protein
MSKITAICRGLLEDRRLPFALAVAAILFMLPALSVGLVGDDLVQRLNQFTPAELPPRILDTGFVAKDSGQLGTVLGNLFGYVRGKEAGVRAMDYGIAPWWASEGWTAALWRPVTAFTHWVDYRLYPNSPALMHAQNIAWFALAVFLVSTLYRKIKASAGGFASDVGETPPWNTPGIWAAGLAACLWLLDWTTYGPVAYVANRGFFIALVFGLFCWHAHVQWRTTKSIAWMWFSALFLLLSILSDEGGASTLAFLLAYAIVLEPGGWRPRLMSLLPAAVVIMGWRAVYVGCRFGVRNFPGYIDPGYAPLSFLKNIVPRMNGLLGGQLTGLPPELAMALNSKWQMILALFFAGVSLICAMVFWPVIRRDAVARFWAVVTLLSLVPAATVAPLSKNLGFIAVGAFGVMASFLIGFAARSERAALPGLLRAMSWCVAICLVAVHVAGAIGCRIAMGLASASLPKLAELAFDYEPSLEIGERDIVVINDPTILSAMIPFYRAYRGEPLPRSTRILVPGSVPFEVNRPDATTLILKAKESDLFDCPDLGPVHLCYACKSANDFLYDVRTWKAGDRVTRKAFVAEILEVSPRGAPRSVAFHFAKPLESDRMVWLFFDWRRGAHRPFALPRIGETVAVVGPRVNLGRIIEEHIAARLPSSYVIAILGIMVWPLWLIKKQMRRKAS